MSNEQPDRIAELSRIICAEVPILIEEARDQINAAINAIIEEAQQIEDGKAVLTLAVSAKWDLNGQSVMVSMPVNVRHKFSRTATMDDPSQPTLPGVTESARESAEKLRKLVKEGKITITTSGGGAA